MSQGYANTGVIRDPSSGIAARVTDHQAVQVTMAQEGKTSFGETLVGQLDPIVQVSFPYNFNPAIMTKWENQSGSVSVASSMLTCSTGAAANSSGTAFTRRAVKYEPGFGVRARFTAKFTTGVANSTQIAGIGNESEGFFFGYNGASFGILRRYNGTPEIRTLTVTTKSSHAENITVTLDGTAIATIAVTNGADTTVTANEIAAGDYSDVGRGWTAKAIGSTVVFVSWSNGARTGTYSVSGTSVAGTFAQTVAGSSSSESWVAQASWNGDDIFDGNGATGVTLDPTKLNVFQIEYQFLGAGAIGFYIEDPDDGELHLVNKIAYANANTTPSVRNPSFPIYISAENTSNTTNLSVSTASAAIFIDGQRRNTGTKYGVSATKTLAAATETPVLSITIPYSYQSVPNKAQVKINYITAAVEHTKPVTLLFYANQTLTASSFASTLTSTVTSLQKDTSATASTGGTLLFAIPLGKTSNAQINLSTDINLAEFGPGDTITVTALPNSSTGAEVSVGFNLTERL